MIASVLILVLGAVCFAAALNVFRPPRWPGPLALGAFFAGWLTGDLPLLQVLVQAALLAPLAAAGGLADWPGQLGMGLLLATWALLAVAWRESGQAHGAIADALGEHGIAIEAADLPYRRLAWPFVFGHPDVERISGVPYANVNGHTLKADVFRPRTTRHDCPVMIFVHGGGWVVGFKQFQGLPVLHRLASEGWLCFSVSYRLAPGATFPDPLIDVKRAIAWVRENASGFGGDPDTLVIHGNSAGAHLASLAAVTANEPELQPGFEDADTSVSACIPMYGVYDLTDTHGNWPHNQMALFIEATLMKLPASRFDAYAMASPLHRVHGNSPPFFLIHGSRDTLVPVGESRTFVRVCREDHDLSVIYAEIPGGQHALDIFPSRRTAAVVEGVAAYAEYIRVTRAEQRQEEDMADWS